MEKSSDQQSRTGPKTRLVEQINLCLRSGEYIRALDLLRGAAAEFPNDAELSGLEEIVQDGVKRNAEANRLITESQELFAQRKSAEAIQLLRKAYELDKRNSLARAILANALVEHAHSLVETDWLEAETLTNQALNLNPAHPTANTIRSLIVEQKQTSSVEDWVARASKLQSSGDLFAALAWVAEGLAVHPDDPKLLQIQDSIQRDQGVRRRQARRGDLDNLRRMELEIDADADDVVKQALAGRIQAMAAKYWTDGEILSIANRLLHQLGMTPKESAGGPRSKGAALIFHVPRPSAPEPPRANTTDAPTRQAPPSQPPPSQPPHSEIPSNTVTPESVEPAVTAASKTASAPQTEVVRPQPATVPAAEASSVKPSALATKIASSSAKPKKPTRSSFPTLIFISAVAIILFAAIFFFVRRHHAPPVTTTTAAAPTGSASAVPAPAVSAPIVSAPTVAAPEETTPEPSSPPAGSSDTNPGKVTVNDLPPADAGNNFGTLLVVAGQDNASVFLNGKLQRQLTQGGELRVPNLELKDYVVQVSKNGFQNPPQQKIRLHQGEQAKLVFTLQPNLKPNLKPNLQPQPSLAALTIQGGTPETTVLVDQTPVGTIQADGTLSVSTVDPGDHTVELRKERFKPRQLKKHFVAGGTIALAAADVALEAASGELKITFAPPDANVAIAKGDLLKIVSSGVPLSLAPGTYTLTARTAERFTRSSTLEVVAGQSKTLDLSLSPSGMSKWDDPGAWKQENASFIRKGGDFVLYGVAPASGTFVFSAMPAKGHMLQWVLNYSDPKNYVLFQIDDKNFYRTVIRKGEKTDEIIVPDKDEKKSFRTIQVRVSPSEVVHQIKHGDRWTVLDRWTQPGTNLSQGKFGFYIPGSDQVALSSFAHYADLNLR